LTTVEAYDVHQNTWSTLAPLSVARGEFGAALGSDGRIYAVGGAVDGAGDPTATVEAYTASTNTWVQVSPLTQGRILNSVVADSHGAILAIGGSVPGCTGLSSVESYDLSTNAWTPGPALPSPQSNTSAGLLGVDGRIYTFGGEVGSDACQSGSASNVFILDETTGAWSAGAPMPAAARGGAAASGAGIGSLIYFFGGVFDGPGLATVQAYDPAKNLW
jgi:N-acetylneuraminic acid mutarotase